MKMDYNSYIASEKFPQGTVFKYYDIAEAIVGIDGFVRQIKRGILEGEECLRKFDSQIDWIKTLPLHSPEEDYKINIEIPNNGTNKIVPPYAPIHVESLSRAYTIVKMINDKNNVSFKIKRSPSYKMLHAQAKMSRMELDSTICWQIMKINNPTEWQNEYNKRTMEIVNTYENVQMSLYPELMNYQVHNPKYPRVFVKNGDMMLPIYHIPDGKGLIYIDGKVGPSWVSLGLSAFPEIWVSWEGRLVKQQICYYMGSCRNTYFNQPSHTQMELAILYNEIPDEKGCLSNGKQVMNLKTRKLLEPWHVV